MTGYRFDAVKLQKELSGLPESPTKIERHGRHAVRAYYGLLETSFISYEQVPAKPDSVAVGGARIRVADIEVMAATKAAAVHDRGARRNFIDIHAICGQPGWSVGRFIEHPARHLPLTPAQVTRALIHYADADRQPMPAGYSVPWNKVKVDLDQRRSRVGSQRTRQGGVIAARPLCLTAFEAVAGQLGPGVGAIEHMSLRWRETLRGRRRAVRPRGSTRIGGPTRSPRSPRTNGRWV